MTFNLPLLFMAAFSYLLLLFFIAHSTNQGWLPKGLARYLLMFALSLRVYATTRT